MSLQRVTGMALFFAAACASAALAQPAGVNPPPGCAAWNADLPPEWSGWAGTPSMVTAARSTDSLGAAAIAIGKRVSVTLAAAKDVKMGVDSPDIDPPEDSHNGMLSLRGSSLTESESRGLIV